MNPQLKKQYEKSDKSLILVKRVLLSAFVILTVGSFITGIVLLTEESLELFGLEWLGFVFFFVLAPLILFLGYRLLMAVLWLMYDVKVIRTAVTGDELSHYLGYFGLFSLSGGAFIRKDEKTTTGIQNGLQNKAREDTGECFLCEAKNVPVFSAEIVSDVGVFHRPVCADCMKKINARPVK